MASTCPKCGLKFSDPTLTPATCPNCGEALPAVVVSDGMGAIRGYFLQVGKILTRPAEFFQTMPTRGGVSGPLAFALITHWLGAAIAYLWRILIGGAFSGFIEHFVKLAGDVADVDHPGRNAQFLEMGERVKNWIWGTGSIIADPFLTLAQIFFISFLVFLGARILVTPGKNGAPREITFESALRIVCYGMTPSILGVLPLFGTVVASFYRVIVSVIGARETYRIDNGRALLVALFPQFLLFCAFFAIFFAMLVAAIKFFSMAF
jgi:hypothetical protein